MTEIGAFEARLGSITLGIDRAQALAALPRIQARAESVQSGGFKWEGLKIDRDEGRP